MNKYMHKQEEEDDEEEADEYFISQTGWVVESMTWLTVLPWSDLAALGRYNWEGNAATMHCHSVSNAVFRRTDGTLRAVSECSLPFLRPVTLALSFLFPLGFRACHKDMSECHHSRSVCDRSFSWSILSAADSPTIESLRLLSRRRQISKLWTAHLQQMMNAISIFI